MKLYIEDEGENFEMEAKAAYVVLIDPADSDADVALMVVGQSNSLKIVSGIAKTLDSFFQTLTKGDRETQRLFGRSSRRNTRTLGLLAPAR